MAFDPHRHVTVASGAFSVDVNELNAAHAALTYEKLLAIGPSKAALTCAQLEVDLAPFDTNSITSAINTALSSLDDLGAAVDDLLWKLRDAALTYDDANSFASLWEAVPGSASGPQFSLLGLARFEATGGFAGALWFPPVSGRRGSTGGSGVGDCDHAASGDGNLPQGPDEHRDRRSGVLEA